MSRKVHLIAGALMVLLTASEAEAQSAPGGGWYVAGAVSRSFLNDADQTIYNAPMPGSTVVLSNDIEDGWGGQLAVGRSFRGLRGEVEFGHTSNEADRYRVSSPFTATVPQDGKQSATRLMANVYVDLLDGPVRPYAGSGAGLANVHVRVFGPRAPFPNEPPRELIDDSDRRLAYQLMAGVAFDVTPNLALTAQYRWFDAGIMEGKDSRGERFIREHNGHNFDVGVRFGF